MADKREAANARGLRGDFGPPVRKGFRHDSTGVGDGRGHQPLRRLRGDSTPTYGAINERSEAVKEIRLATECSELRIDSLRPLQIYTPHDYTLLAPPNL